MTKSTIDHHERSMLTRSTSSLTATLHFRDPSRLDQCQFRQRINANATASHGRPDSLSRYDNYDDGVSDNDDDDDVVVDDDVDDNDYNDVDSDGSSLLINYAGKIIAGISLVTSLRYVRSATLKYCILIFVIVPCDTFFKNVLKQIGCVFFSRRE